MQTKNKWLGLATVILFLGWITPAHADISAVNPPEGTIGTTFTIVGSGFGERRGKVHIGAERCKVISWSDTQITCEVVIAQPAGDYTVTLSLHGSMKKSAPQTYSPFVMRRPQIDAGEPLRLVTPLEVVTITGDFFGDKKGQVGMRDTTGLTLEARVFDWSMHSITFEVPTGLTGSAHLGVKNDVGIGIRPYWCTFTPLPATLPKGTLRTYFIKETHSNATGMFFNNEFWIFFPENDPSEVNDIAVRKFNYKEGTFSTVASADKPGGQTDTQLAPIVIDHELWLFHTGESGQLFYKRYTIVGTGTNSQPIYGWEVTWHRIGGTGTAIDKMLAPVWDPIKNRLEVFYWNSSSIYRVYSDDKGATWHTTAKVEGLGTVDTAPSAVFWQQTATNGVTLLAFTGLGNPDISDTTDYAKVYAVRDGVMVGAQPLWWSLDRSSKPFIAHLGEDYIGLVFENGPLDQVDVAKMNKKTGIWNYSPLVPYLDQDVERNPSIAVNLQEEKDDSAPLGVRYDAVAYLFWGAKSGASGTGAYMSSVETLGWWQEDGITDFDTSTERPDTFNLWQVVGVVDAPPFVLNGAEYSYECLPTTCNSLTFVNEQETSTTFAWDMSLGAFFETGDKSPVKVELTATMSAKFEETKKTTVESKTRLFRSKAGTVSVWYLAPNIRTHHMQWYDMTGNQTSNYIQQMEILSVQLLSQEFDPRGFPWPDLHAMPPTYFTNNFPIHASDPYEYTNNPSEADWEHADWARLATYTREQTDPTWFSNPMYWNRSSEKDLTWITSGTTNKEFGFEVKYKIGVQVGEYFGIGTEGSFGVKTTSEVTVGNESELHLVPGLENGEPFESFRIDGYWLEPNADGYWVPLNRRGTGDAPWFITYRVSDITPTSP